MARKPKTTPAAEAPALTLALRLRAALLDDPDYPPDDVPVETSGAIEPGAMFHAADAEGRLWRVRVIRAR